MEWLWSVALKKAGVAIVLGVVAILSSPKVVGVLNYLAEKGLHINISVDQTVASVSILGLLTFLRNYLKNGKPGLKFL